MDEANSEETKVKQCFKVRRQKIIEENYFCIKRVQPIELAKSRLEFRLRLEEVENDGRRKYFAIIKFSHYKQKLLLSKENYQREYDIIKERLEYGDYNLNIGVDGEINMIV